MPALYLPLPTLVQIEAIYHRCDGVSFFDQNLPHLQIGGVALEELNGLELATMHALDFQLRVGALPVTQTLARINASADASDATLAARFRALLLPAALAAIGAEAAVSAAAAGQVAAAGSNAGDAAAAAIVSCPGQQQQRRSSLDCRAASSVMPFVSGGIAAH